MSLDRDELAHYARHLVLPDVGLVGQEKLKRAKVLVVGMGGLGAPVALYLAAAGVGRIGLVDPDVVSASNLHRQVLFGAADVGRPKVLAAAKRLRDLNPHIQIDVHETRFTAGNAHDLLRDHDILVDGTDNFPTRYLCNDVAVLQGKPNVHASIFRFEGQASVFDARRGPCYRCVWPRPPPPDLVPSCAEGGVLGVLPGIVGSIQAAETIKLILGAGEPLVGKLLLVDALGMEFTTLRLDKDPRCALCGKDATQKDLIDYEAFCGTPASEDATAAHASDIEPRDLARRIAQRDAPFLLDVREEWEARIARIDGAHLIPLAQLPARAAELPLDRDIVAYCRSGARSGRAVELLRQAGHTRVRNLAGGIARWADEVDATVARY